MGYVFPWLYYDDNISEWNNFTYTSNATGANIQDVITVLCSNDLSENYLCWLIPFLIIVLVIACYLDMYFW